MPAASKLMEKKRKREEEVDSDSSDEESTVSKTKQNNAKAGKVAKAEESEDSSSSDDDSGSDSDSDSDSSSDEEEDKKKEAEKKKKLELEKKKKEEQEKAKKAKEAKKEDKVKAPEVSKGGDKKEKKEEKKVEKKEEKKGANKKDVKASEDVKKAATPAKKDASKAAAVAVDPAVTAWRQAQNLSIQGDNCPAPYMSFADAPFPDYISNALKSLKFEKPTPIQAQAWPLALGGRDMIGLAETGSGKTLAFILPGVVHTANKSKAERAKGASVLVLAPTRELAQQIESVTATTCAAANIKSACVYGGVPKGQQASKIKGAEVIIATPGRLIDFMNDGEVKLGNVSYLVLDEADRMLDMGFELQINEIMRSITCATRQTLMFSATWPSDVQRLSQKFFTDPIKITIGSETLKGAKKVTQIIEACEEYEKKKKLRALLNNVFKDNCRILIFMLYKKTCNGLFAELEREGWPVGCINGDMNQNARDNTLAQFKSGKKPIMIATDVAARGLDIKEVKYVINVEFPLKCEDYVHRIGRTGRAGEAGTAYTFFGENDKAHARELCRIVEESGQTITDAKFLAIVDKAPGIKPKKSAMQELYGDFAKGKNMEGMAKAPTRITFD